MVNEIYKKLEEHYESKPFLKAQTPMENLVSVVLSAQCTDKKVNEVTKDLFRKYTNVKDYAEASLYELEQDIYSTGFYRMKAKAIKESAKKILSDFGGKVPSNMKDLLKLWGIARKSANIILWQSYGKVEGIAVDTHVKRVTYRFGLTSNKDPVRIEKDLMKILPKSRWAKFSYLVVSHGRALCKAPTPICSKCFLNDICPKKSVTRKN